MWHVSNSAHESGFQFVMWISMTTLDVGPIFLSVFSTLFESQCKTHAALLNIIIIFITYFFHDNPLVIFIVVQK